MALGEKSDGVEGVGGEEDVGLSEGIICIVCDF